MGTKKICGRSRLAKHDICKTRVSVAVRFRWLFRISHCSPPTLYTKSGASMALAPICSCSRHRKLQATNVWSDENRLGSVQCFSDHSSQPSFSGCRGIPADSDAATSVLNSDSPTLRNISGGALFKHQQLIFKTSIGFEVFTSSHYGFLRDGMSPLGKAGKTVTAA